MGIRAIFRNPDRWWVSLIIPAVMAGLALMRDIVRSPYTVNQTPGRVVAHVGWLLLFVVWPSVVAGALYSQRQAMRGEWNWLTDDPRQRNQGA